MGAIAAGIAGVASWMGAGAATASAIGTVGAGALAVGGAVAGSKAMSKSGTGGDASTLMGPQSKPQGEKEEEEVTLGSSRTQKKGNKPTGRRQLMADQSTSTPAPASGTGLRV